MRKATFTITGMHCTSCAMNIDGELEDASGIISASTYYAKQMLEVSFDEKKITENDIITIVKKAGYIAESQ